jgi:hypothetical protein
MKRTILVAGLCVAVVLAGCSTTSRHLTPGTDVVKRIGLPLYPRHVRLLPAEEIAVNTPLGVTTTLSQPFMTSDDFDSVKGFYEENTPAVKREIAIPMAGMRTVTMQFVQGTIQKEVVVVTLRGTTMVTLQSTDLKMTKPAASPS